MSGSSVSYRVTVTNVFSIKLDFVIGSIFLAHPDSSQMEAAAARQTAAAAILFLFCILPYLFLV